MHQCNLWCVCISDEIHPLRCHTPKFVNPESFPSPSELNVIVSKLLNDHDGQVFHGMSTSIEVLSHWFLCLVFDVISMAIEADVQGILCQTDILFWALPALYQIDHTLCLAGSRCVHLVGFFGHSASKHVCGFDVSTSLTASPVAWPVSIPPSAFSGGMRNNVVKWLCM